MSIHPLLRQIIDRDCHVALSNRAVIRHVISRLKGGYHTFRTLSKWERKELLRQCVAVHQKNVRFYRQVMGGWRG